MATRRATRPSPERGPRVDHPARHPGRPVRPCHPAELAARRARPKPGRPTPRRPHPQAARVLTTGASTVDAASTVLALHLNLPPTHLHCFTVGAIATDGSTLTPPTDSFTNHHHGLAHAVLADESPSGIRERACLGPIRIPEPARPIIAAHLAYRRLQGANDHDPYFAYRHDLRRRPTAALREAAIRLCERIHVNPPWLHRDPCKYGADIGLTPRTHGWLIERSLALAQLDRYTAAAPGLPLRLHRRADARRRLTAPSSSGCAPPDCPCRNSATCSASTRTCCTPSTATPACTANPSTP